MPLYCVFLHPGINTLNRIFRRLDGQQWPQDITICYFPGQSGGILPVFVIRPDALFTQIRAYLAFFLANFLHLFDSFDFCKISCKIPKVVKVVKVAKVPKVVNPPVIPHIWLQSQPHRSP